MHREFTLLMAIAGLGILSPCATPQAQAETYLEESGTIVPAERSYTFEGKAENTVTITLTSDAFDTVVALYDSAGTELATNDDFGGTLNSTIIITLPADDTYTVVARSFTGQGGDYTLAVRTATPYEVTYGKGLALAQEEDYEGAIAAYTEAIATDPEQPSAYLGRAEAYLGKLYADMGDQITGPADIPAPDREAIITDFEAAADLIEAIGNTDWANSLREQANYLRAVETAP